MKTNREKLNQKLESLYTEHLKVQAIPELRELIAIVTFKTSNGHRICGRLVKENKKTAVVKPYKWIKMDAIKIHKVKQGMEFTGETI